MPEILLYACPKCSFPGNTKNFDDMVKCERCAHPFVASSGKNLNFKKISGEEVPKPSAMDKSPSKLKGLDKRPIHKPLSKRKLSGVIEKQEQKVPGEIPKPSVMDKPPSKLKGLNKPPTIDKPLSKRKIPVVIEEKQEIEEEEQEKYFYSSLDWVCIHCEGVGKPIEHSIEVKSVYYLFWIIMFLPILSFFIFMLTEGLFYSYVMKNLLPVFLFLVIFLVLMKIFLNATIGSYRKICQHTKKKMCFLCNSTNIIPVDSSKGKKLTRR